MKRIPLLLCFALVTSALFSQVKTRSYIVDAQLAPRDHNVDFQHLRLEVSFDAPNGLVKGKVTHVFTPLRATVDSIWLDAIEMRFKSVQLNGKDVKYKNDSAGISIFPDPALPMGKQDSITLVYECTPKKGLYFIGWNDPKNLSRKQIWSQGQDIDNRNWIPQYDECNDKLISELIVTFDKEYKVLSNGTKLSEKDNKDGTKTWHYTMTHPHASYLIMLGIGKYDIDERKSKSGVPLHLYYYPEWKDRVAITYQHSEEMIDFYEKEFGVKYPWESYSQIPVQDFMYGAMENTTATVYGDFFVGDSVAFNDRYYIGVNAHELMHQWFGDYVTARSNAHHWLQESFATYGNMLYEREVNGKDFFDWGRRGAQNACIDESVKNKLPVVNSEAGGVRHYPKGAFVLNMLKYVVGGAEVYNKCIKHYLETHPYSNVDTHDLLIAFEDVTGMQLDWFFEEWLYKGGEPSYKVSWNEAYQNTVITVMQTQELNAITGLPESGKSDAAVSSTDEFVSKKDADVYHPAGLWKMPIWFEVHYKDGTFDKKQAWIENQTDIVKIPNTSSKTVDYVLFDPNNEVMKSVSFNKPYQMLRAQALNAPNMLDRFDAVAAMKNTDVQTKRDFFVQLYDKEKFQAVKNEMITQVVEDKNPKTYHLLRLALNDKDILVQKNVLAGTKTIPSELLPDYEKLLNARSYDLVASALEKLCHDNPSGTKVYLEKTKNMEGTNGKNVRIKWLEIAAATDDKYIQQLIEYTSISYEFKTRTNAFTSLKKLNYFSIPLMDNIINAVLSANGRLAGPAGEALQFFYTQDKYKKPIDDYVASKEWEGWKHDKIFTYLK